jgi:NTE family protein
MARLWPGPAPSAPEDRLLGLLRRLPLFQALAEPTLAEVRQELSWFTLPAGAVLFQQDAPGDALYVLASGMLAVTVTDRDGNPRRLAYIFAGETVGELALISGEPRSATVTALRDSNLLRLDRPAFERLLAEHPQTATQLLRLLAARMLRSTRAEPTSHRARAIALINLDPGIPADQFAAKLARRLDAIDPPARDLAPTQVLGPEAAGSTEEAFHEAEITHVRLLYVAALHGQAQPDDLQWARRCHRQADHLLLLTRPTTRLSAAVRDAISQRRHEPRPHDVVLLQPAEQAAALQPGPDILGLPADLHLNLQVERTADLDRLARLLTARANGLVLAGGGARGYSHIGVIKALDEAGMPIDLLGGASIGGVMAAGLAIGWSWDELYRRIRDAFVTDNPVDDFTLPFVALTRGRKVQERLQAHFGELTFEQSWRPLYCVSSNLTKGGVEVHRRGLLWQALRASIAIPGLLPPSIQRGEVLVDGGVMNNLPTDIMRGFGRGRVVAVDVGQVRALACALADYADYPWWRVLLGRPTGAPGIATLLIRAATVSSEVYTRSCRAQADLLFTPPVEEVDLRAWKSLDRCVEAGYRHALDVLAKVDKPWW